MAEDNGLFVLAQGVEFIPMADVPEKTRIGFEYEKDDVVVTYTNTRNRSKVISPGFAALLKSFQQPQSYASAIFSYSKTTGKDPMHVADEVFALLQSMEQQGFLEKQTDEKNKKPSSKLKAGDSFRGFTVVKKVYGYEDTEVYQAKGKDENLYALKLLTATGNPYVMALFENEVKALKKLDGDTNPAMIAAGEHDGLPFIVMDWCYGRLCYQEAVMYKNSGSRQHAIKLLDMCIAIANAFHKLHVQGVLHGDIQEGNILVTHDGKVKILDYGYAMIEGQSNQPQRGGTGFFYEPEYTVSVLDKKPAPALSAKAEQYSLAVLFYKLITGHQYLDFSFEKEKLFRQIAETPPNSFKKYDLLLPSSLEEALMKALAKKPGERFDSVQAFANALQQCRDEILQSNNFFIGAAEKKDSAFMDFLARKYSEENIALQKPPNCSANFGAAGIAYFFCRMACIKQDNNYLSLADKWNSFALANAEDYDTAFYCASIGISEETVGRHSLYHSPAGIYLVQAIIDNAKGNLHGLQKSMDSYIAEAESDCPMVDLALGRAGLLLGCSFLHREIKSIENISTTALQAAAEKLLQSIWDETDAITSIKEKNGIDYFGVAHGWAGLLYASLHWCSTAGKPLPKNFMNRVDDMLACAIKKEDKMYWPLTVADGNKWPGWCNGNAGHIYLWLLLYQFFKDEKYLAVATGLANDLIGMPQNNNSTLCCGSTGQAYSMMAMYNATGEDVYYKEAMRLKKVMEDNLFSPLLDVNSLYKGDVGIGLLLCEMRNPDMARLPLFE